jgi:hypothetical protein
VATDIGAGEAHALNENGRVVGVSGLREPFVWEDGVRDSHPIPAGARSAEANFINNAGWIAGYASTPETGESGPYLPLLWKPSECGATDAGTPPGAPDSAVSDAGPPVPPPEEPTE